MPRITMDGKYTTRDERAVRVLCVNLLRDKYPVCAAITDQDGSEFVIGCTAGGFYQYGNQSHMLDLIEVPPPPEMIPLDESDIVLGKTVVMVGDHKHLIHSASPATVSWHSVTVTYAELRQFYNKISFDNGATFGPAEKAKPAQ